MPMPATNQTSLTRIVFTKYGNETFSVMPLKEMTLAPQASATVVVMPHSFLATGVVRNIKNRA